MKTFPPPNLSCYPATKINSNGIVFGDNPLNYSLPLFALQVVLLLIITQLIRFLLRPLKQPRFVSHLLGGIILGPSVLGHNDTFKRVMFPQRGAVLLETVGGFGVIYWVFLIGVKLDPHLIRKSGRKPIVIGLVGLLLSIITMTVTSYFIRKFLPKALDNLLLTFLPGLFSLSSFVVVVPILYEFHLVNSELSKLAMPAAMMDDICGWIFSAIVFTWKTSSASPMTSISAFLALCSLMTFIFIVIRPATFWIISQTPEGRPVEEVFILSIFVLVLVIAFVGDTIGANSFNMALMLGLAIPDGPPLGAALVEKLECIISSLLLPIYFLVIGQKTNVFTIHDSSKWSFLQLVIIIGCISKLLGTLLSSLYYKMPFREAISLSLLMNSKGIIEVFILNYWKEIKIIDDQTFSILILSVLLVTAIVTPILQLVYQPSRKYVIYRRQTIQHSRPDTEFGVLACIHTESNVPTLINFLESFYPTKRSPISVYALHLIKLIGSSAPHIITHEMSRTSSMARSNINQSEHIINAFRIYQQQHEDAVSLHPFTAIAPYESMNEDVLTLALQKQVSLMIIPFHKQPLVNGNMETNSAIQALNRNILAAAPCSVGILIDRAITTTMCTLSGQFLYNVGVIYFGGDDDREILACADRMAMHPCIYITIFRFLASASIKDHSRERKVDEEMLGNFKQTNMRNNRIKYVESVVEDMEEIVVEIKSLSRENYDLLMVGMRHETTILLDYEFRDWNECLELGAMGDILASQGLESKASVLVVRQQSHIHSNMNQTLPSSNVTQRYRTRTLSRKEQADEGSVASPAYGNRNLPDRGKGDELNAACPAHWNRNPSRREQGNEATIRSQPYASFNSSPREEGNEINNV